MRMPSYPDGVFEYSGSLSELGKTGMSETPGTWAAYLSILPWHFDWGRRSGGGWKWDPGSGNGAAVNV
jgi:hypothetical protein